jgi:hypothetical protein
LCLFPAFVCAKFRLHLKQLSIEEKIKIMENIWNDLCRKASSLSSPLWHKDILKEREKK